jgi:hypothetical protein
MEAMTPPSRFGKDLPMTETTYDTRTETRDGTIERDESSRLISSTKVEGTPVFATDGERLGHIDHLMIGKFDGRVAFSVMSFGGFLGLGESYHPIPWESLDYDTERGGYVVNFDKSRLKDAPYYEGGNPPAYGPNYDNSIYSFYGAVPPVV